MSVQPTDPWLEAPTLTTKTRSPLRRHLDRPSGRKLLVGAIALTGPVLATYNAAGAASAAAVLAAGAAATLLVSSTSPPLARSASVVGAAVATAWAASPFIGLWLMVSLIVATWSVLHEPPLPALPRGDDVALPGVVILSTAASWQGIVGDRELSIGLIMAGTLALTWLTAASPRTFSSAVSRVGETVAAAVGFVGFGVLGLFVVLLPWVTHRVRRRDPLALLGGDTGGCWISRCRLPRTPKRQWAPEAAMLPTSSGLRLGRLILPIILLAVVALQLTGDPSGQVGHLATRLGLVPLTPAAFAGEDWYPQHREDVDWLSTRATAWSPLEYHRLKNVRTQTVNVTDGVRRTWAPPPCNCQRFSVWMYGGSTTFGLGQRDEHTIASELARFAWEDGIALDVANRGMPSDTHLREAQRFGWDVATHGPPDHVVFLDGYNEAWAVQSLLNSGVGDIAEPFDPVTRNYWEQEGGFGSPIEELQAPTAPDGASLLPPSDGGEHDGADGAARLAVARYARALRVSGDTATANNIPIQLFWQPTRHSRPPIPGEPEPGEGNDWAKQRATAMRTLLPAVVHDLSDVFDAEGSPIYSDDVHHNEQGAHLIAAAMWDVLAAEILAAG